MWETVLNRIVRGAFSRPAESDAGQQKRADSMTGIEFRDAVHG